MSNLAIWDAVSKTNPKDTKKVNQRGGFTSVCAQSQIKAATNQFGPIGKGWGYNAGEPIFHDNLVFIQVTLWHGEFGQSFGPVTGGAEWKDKNGRLDSDACKKATTDAVTKLLSQLGFNADVFLGLYDDSKYVETVTREFAEQERASVPTIDDAQRTELMQWFDSTKTAVKPYLERASANAGVPVNDLRDLPATEFAPLLAHLKSKNKEPANA